MVPVEPSSQLSSISCSQHTKMISWVAEKGRNLYSWQFFGTKHTLGYVGNQFGTLQDIPGGRSDVMVPVEPSSWEIKAPKISEVILFDILGIYGNFDGMAHGILPEPPCCQTARFLQSVQILKCKFTVASKSACVWRRLQVHEQQSERTRKNVLQKVMTFTARARELAVQDFLGLGIHISSVLRNVQCSVEDKSQ